MPQIPQKEIRRAVMQSTCPDTHKEQFAQTLAEFSSTQGLNLGGLGRIIQAVEQFVIKYGPSIWADIQVFLQLFSGGLTPPAPHPQEPGPTPAQQLSDRGGSVSLFALIILCVMAVLALWFTPSSRAGQLPQSTLSLPQNTLCPCGTDCPCGPDCQCGADCQCGKKAAIGEDAVAMLAPEQDANRAELPQGPKAAAPAPVAVAPVAASPTFHLEQRSHCGLFGCRPYMALVMDAPQACAPVANAGCMGGTAQGAYGQSYAAYSYSAPATTYRTVRVPVTTYQTQSVQVPVTSYQDVQVPTTTYQYQSGCATCGTASYGASYGESFAVSGECSTRRRGIVQAFREWRASAHARRVGGAFSCGG